MKDKPAQLSPGLDDAVHCPTTRQHHLIFMSAPALRPHRTKLISVTCHGDGRRSSALEFLTLTGPLINFRHAAPATANLAQSSPPLPLSPEPKPTAGGTQPVMYRTREG
ncbi:hypothetical protein DPEC_G00030610 [Dallia pectoralis]|uniref:Uncharacterized protein n=1 Tax=Dallia pectoralis TaxID=75939 RepID=A0ACC2HCB1_DALPE|nr:hypothetical protein DPEC_G00030610 [Dallia pectoralis]